MGQSLKIKADAYLIQAYDALSLYTGKTMAEDVLGDAIALTATALQKSDEGYVVQTIRQSIGHDKFNYPFVPRHIYQDMKRRPPAPPGREIFLSVTPRIKTNLALICKTLNLNNKQDAIRFSATFAFQVATELRKTPGRVSLAYVDSTDRRFGEIAKTPYDRSLRNDFNRLFREFQDWWKCRDDRGRGGNPPSNHPPYPLAP